MHRQKKRFSAVFSRDYWIIWLCVFLFCLSPNLYADGEVDQASKLSSLQDGAIQEKDPKNFCQNNTKIKKEYGEQCSLSYEIARKAKDTVTQEEQKTKSNIAQFSEELKAKIKSLKADQSQSLVSGFARRVAERERQFTNYIAENVAKINAREAIHIKIVKELIEEKEKVQKRLDKVEERLNSKRIKNNPKRYKNTIRRLKERLKKESENIALLDNAIREQEASRRNGKQEADFLDRKKQEIEAYTAEVLKGADEAALNALKVGSVADENVATTDAKGNGSAAEKDTAVSNGTDTGKKELGSADSKKTDPDTATEADQQAVADSSVTADPEIGEQTQLGIGSGDVSVDDLAGMEAVLLEDDKTDEKAKIKESVKEAGVKTRATQAAIDEAVEAAEAPFLDTEDVGEEKSGVPPVAGQVAEGLKAGVANEYLRQATGEKPSTEIQAIVDDPELTQDQKLALIGNVKDREMAEAARADSKALRNRIDAGERLRREGDPTNATPEAISGLKAVDEYNAANENIDAAKRDALEKVLGEERTLNYKKVAAYCEQNTCPESLRDVSDGLSADQRKEAVATILRNDLSYQEAEEKFYQTEIQRKLGATEVLERAEDPAPLPGRLERVSYYVDAEGNRLVMAQPDRSKPGFTNGDFDQSELPELLRTGQVRKVEGFQTNEANNSVASSARKGDFYVQLASDQVKEHPLEQGKKIIALDPRSQKTAPTVLKQAITEADGYIDEAFERNAERQNKIENAIKTIRAEGTNGDSFAGVESLSPKDVGAASNLARNQVRNAQSDLNEVIKELTIERSQQIGETTVLLGKSSFESVAGSLKTLNQEYKDAKGVEDAILYTELTVNGALISNPLVGVVAKGGLRAAAIGARTLNSARTAFRLETTAAKIGILSTGNEFRKSGIADAKTASTFNQGLFSGKGFTKSDIKSFRAAHSEAWLQGKFAYASVAFAPLDVLGVTSSKAILSSTIQSNARAAAGLDRIPDSEKSKFIPIPAQIAANRSSQLVDSGTTTQANTAIVANDSAPVVARNNPEIVAPTVVPTRIIQTPEAANDATPAGVVSLQKPANRGEREALPQVQTQVEEVRLVANGEPIVVNPSSGTRADSGSTPAAAIPTTARGADGAETTVTNSRTIASVEAPKPGVASPRTRVVVGKSANDIKVEAPKPGVASPRSRPALAGGARSANDNIVEAPKPGVASPRTRVVVGKSANDIKVEAPKPGVASPRTRTVVGERATNDIVVEAPRPTTSPKDRGSAVKRRVATQRQAEANRVRQGQAPRSTISDADVADLRRQVEVMEAIQNTPNVASVRTTANVPANPLANPDITSLSRAANDLDQDPFVSSFDPSIQTQARTNRGETSSAPTPSSTAVARSDIPIGATNANSGSNVVDFPRASPKGRGTTADRRAVTQRLANQRAEKEALARANARQASRYDRPLVNQNMKPEAIAKLKAEVEAQERALFRANSIIDQAPNNQTMTMAQVKAMMRKIDEEEAIARGQARISSVRDRQILQQTMTPEEVAKLQADVLAQERARFRSNSPFERQAANQNMTAEQLAALARKLEEPPRVRNLAALNRNLRERSSASARRPASIAQENAASSKDPTDLGPTVKVLERERPSDRIAASAPVEKLSDPIGGQNPARSDPLNKSEPPSLADISASLGRQFPEPNVSSVDSALVTPTSLNTSSSAQIPNVRVNDQQVAGTQRQLTSGDSYLNNYRTQDRFNPQRNSIQDREVALDELLETKPRLSPEAAEKLRKARAESALDALKDAERAFDNIGTSIKMNPKIQAALLKKHGIKDPELVKSLIKLANRSPEEAVASVYAIVKQNMNVANQIEFVKLKLNNVNGQDLVALEQGLKKPEIKDGAKIVDGKVVENTWLGQLTRSKKSANVNQRDGAAGSFSYYSAEEVVKNSKLGLRGRVKLANAEMQRVYGRDLSFSELKAFIRAHNISKDTAVGQLTILQLRQQSKALQEGSKDLALIQRAFNESGILGGPITLVPVRRADTDLASTIDESGNILLDSRKANRQGDRKKPKSEIIPPNRLPKKYERLGQLIDRAPQRTAYDPNSGTLIQVISLKKDYDPITGRLKPNTAPGTPVRIASGISEADLQQIESVLRVTINRDPKQLRQFSLRPAGSPSARPQEGDDTLGRVWGEDAGLNAGTLVNTSSGVRRSNSVVVQTESPPKFSGRKNPFDLDNETLAIRDPDADSIRYGADALASAKKVNKADIVNPGSLGTPRQRTYREATKTRSISTGELAKAKVVRPKTKLKPTSRIARDNPRIVNPSLVPPLARNNASASRAASVSRAQGVSANPAAARASGSSRNATASSQTKDTAAEYLAKRKQDNELVTDVLKDGREIKRRRKSAQRVEKSSLERNAGLSAREEALINGRSLSSISDAEKLKIYEGRIRTAEGIVFGQAISKGKTVPKGKFSNKQKLAVIRAHEISSGQGKLIGELDYADFRKQRELLSEAFVLREAKDSADGKLLPRRNIVARDGEKIDVVRALTEAGILGSTISRRGSLTPTPLQARKTNFDNKLAKEDVEAFPVKERGHPLVQIGDNGYVDKPASLSARANELISENVSGGANAAVNFKTVTNISQGASLDELAKITDISDLSKQNTGPLIAKARAKAESSVQVDDAVLVAYGKERISIFQARDITRETNVDEIVEKAAKQSEIKKGERLASFEDTQNTKIMESSRTKQIGLEYVDGKPHLWIGFRLEGGTVGRKLIPLDQKGLEAYDRFANSTIRNSRDALEAFDTEMLPLIYASATTNRRNLRIVDAVEEITNLRRRFPNLDESLQALHRRIISPDSQYSARDLMYMTALLKKANPEEAGSIVKTASGFKVFNKSGGVLTVNNQGTVSISRINRLNPDAVYYQNGQFLQNVRFLRGKKSGKVLAVVDDFKRDRRVINPDDSPAAKAEYDAYLDTMDPEIAKLVRDRQIAKAGTSVLPKNMIDRAFNFERSIPGSEAALLANQSGKKSTTVAAKKPKAGFFDRLFRSSSNPAKPKEKLTETQAGANKGNSNTNTNREKLAATGTKSASGKSELGPGNGRQTRGLASGANKSGGARVNTSAKPSVKDPFNRSKKSKERVKLATLLGNTKYGEAEQKAFAKFRTDYPEATKIQEADFKARAYMPRIKAAQRQIFDFYKIELIPAQQKAIIDAHEVGAQQGKKIGQLTSNDFLEQARILKEAGLRKYHRELVELGFLGDAPTAASTSRLSDSAEGTTRTPASTIKSDSENQPGFFESLYNRWFGDSTKPDVISAVYKKDEAVELFGSEASFNIFKRNMQKFAEANPEFAARIANDLDITSKNDRKILTAIMYQEIRLGNADAVKASLDRFERFQISRANGARGTGNSLYQELADEIVKVDKKIFEAKRQGVSEAKLRKMLDQRSALMVENQLYSIADDAKILEIRPASVVNTDSPVGSRPFLGKSLVIKVEFTGDVNMVRVGAVDGGFTTLARERVYLKANEYADLTASGVRSENGISERLNLDMVRVSTRNRSGMQAYLGAAGDASFFNKKTKTMNGGRGGAPQYYFPDRNNRFTSKDVKGVSEVLEADPSSNLSQLSYSLQPRIRKPKDLKPKQKAEIKREYENEYRPQMEARLDEAFQSIAKVDRAKAADAGKTDYDLLVDKCLDCKDATKLVREMEQKFAPNAKPMSGTSLYDSAKKRQYQALSMAEDLKKRIAAVKKNPEKFSDAEKNALIEELRLLQQISNKLASNAFAKFNRLRKSDLSDPTMTPEQRLAKFQEIADAEYQSRIMGDLNTQVNAQNFYKIEGIDFQLSNRSIFVDASGSLLTTKLKDSAPNNTLDDLAEDFDATKMVLVDPAFQRVLARDTASLDEILEAAAATKKKIEKSNRRVLLEQERLMSPEKFQAQLRRNPNVSVDLDATPYQRGTPSGDLFDSYATKDMVRIVVGDASGKGYVTAKTTNRFLKLLKQKKFRQMAANPKITEDQILTEMYKEYKKRYPKDDYFVALQSVSIDTKTGKLSYVNMGSDYLIVRRANGEIEFLQEGTVPFNAIDIPIESSSTKLNPGDQVVLMTDGITDNLSGEARRGLAQTIVDLEKFLGRAPTNAEIKNAIVSATLKQSNKELISGAGKLHDDTTIAVIRYDGNENARSNAIAQTEIDALDKVRRNAFSREDSLASKDPVTLGKSRAISSQGADGNFYAESIVKRNSELEDAPRSLAIRESLYKPGKSREDLDRQVAAAMKAHEKVACDIGKCTTAQLQEKIRIMVQESRSTGRNGKPQNDGISAQEAKVLIRQGLTGNSSTRFSNSNKGFLTSFSNRISSIFASGPSSSGAFGELANRGLRNIEKATDASGRKYFSEKLIRKLANPKAGYPEPQLKNIDANLSEKDKSLIEAYTNGDAGKLNIAGDAYLPDYPPKKIFDVLNKNRYGGSLTDAELFRTRTVLTGLGYSVGESSADILKSLRQYDSDLSSALNQIPSKTEIVFRRTSKSPKQLAEYKVGDIVSETAFSSTSRDPSLVTQKAAGSGKSEGQKPVKIVYLSNSGKSIAPFSAEMEASEVLILPGTKFEVVARTTNKHRITDENIQTVTSSLKAIDEQEVTVVYLRELPDTETIERAPASINRAPISGSILAEIPENKRFQQRETQASTAAKKPQVIPSNESPKERAARIRREWLSEGAGKAKIVSAPERRSNLANEISESVIRQRKQERKQVYEPGARISYSDEDAVVERVIGAGNEGVAYLVRIGGEQRVLKVFNQGQSNKVKLSFDRFKDLFANGIRIAFKDYDLANNAILMEYVDGFSLDVIRKNREALGMSIEEFDRLDDQFVQFLDRAQARNFTIDPTNVVYDFSKKEFVVVDTQ